MEKIENYKIFHSVYPLMYWTKNEYISEYSKNMHLIHGKGSGFLYKSKNNFYFITAKHNFYNDDTTGITEYMGRCCLLSNPLQYKSDITINDFTIKNMMKLYYVPIAINNDLACYNDICIFHITKNLPSSEYCLSYEKLPIDINDYGYAIGYPTNLKEINKYSINITKAILPVEIDRLEINNMLLVYKHCTKLKNINGFSGGALLQYFKNEDRFIFMGMTITAGSDILKIIPSSVIQELVTNYEKNHKFIKI